MSDYYSDEPIVMDPFIVDGGASSAPEDDWDYGFDDSWWDFENELGFDLWPEDEFYDQRSWPTKPEVIEVTSTEPAGPGVLGTLADVGKKLLSGAEAVVGFAGKVVGTVLGAVGSGTPGGANRGPGQSASSMGSPQQQQQRKPKTLVRVERLADGRQRLTYSDGSTEIRAAGASTAPAAGGAELAAVALAGAVLVGGVVIWRNRR